MVHLPPPWSVMCFSVLSVIYFDGQGFAYPCVSTSAPPSLTSSSMEAPSAVHHVVRMSSRALPVIIFVSLIDFLNMFMLSVARSAFGGRRRLLHCMHAIACLPLRLVHSLLFLLLLLPPPCSLLIPWLSDFSYLTVTIYSDYSVILKMVCLFLRESVIIMCHI